MYIQTALRLHIVTSTEISMIAAPNTKLNMPKFISIQTDKAIYLCACRDIARNANESINCSSHLSVYSALIAASYSCTVPSYTALRTPRVAQDGGRACQGRTGRTHSPRVKSQLEELQWGSQTFCSQAGMQLQPAQKRHHAHSPATQTQEFLEHFFQPAAASSHHKQRVNKVIPELPWQEEPPTGTRSALQPWQGKAAAKAPSRQENYNMIVLITLIAFPGIEAGLIQRFLC